MATLISGAVLSGLGSTFLIGRRSGAGRGEVIFGWKNVIIAPQRKKSWVMAAVKGDDGNSKLDPKWLDDASEKAFEYVKEKGSEVGHLTAHEGQEVLDHIQRAKHYFMEKAGVAMDMLTENAHIASDFVAEKANVMEEEAVSITEKARDFVVEKTGEAKDFIVEKAGEAKELATDMSKRTAIYVGEKAAEAKEAILPPKTEE
ncbi:hypothetical protein F2Q69_00055705 [Brassica cretica]|uniref:Uncharacterized protein n=1 Tax=Brassica cretica TaxID=69181 RepID=A0A8S9N2M0_BRACR|nr:hypothetical protein F2Q69_00055705 [Brassica cretica]